MSQHKYQYDHLFSLREARWSDAMTIWRWRNDPDVRKWMRSDREFGLLEHLRWFWRMRPYVYMGECSDEVPPPSPPVRVSTINVRPVGGGHVKAFEFSVIVAPGHSGMGIGRKTILEAVRCLHGCVSSLCLAVVRADNKASIKAFKASGFVYCLHNNWGLIHSSLKYKNGYCLLWRWTHAM